MTMGITSPTSTTGQILKNGSAVISFDANNNATFAGNVAPTVNPTMRNRIINGDMTIDQRNAGASTTPTASGYTLDRWRAGLSVTSKFSVQQSSTAPTGFNKSLLVTSLSAYTVGSGEQFTMAQRIEGYNIADLGWGTANAKTITISFWVRSSLTGTFGGALRNIDQTRSYPFTYTISSANTWEQKTLTISGDTTGTWNSTNDIGVIVSFALSVGSTYLGTAGAWAGADYVGATGQTQILATNGATFYITGVQLEAGSVATPFEQRLYGQELALCQRYFETSYEAGYAVGSTSNPTRSIVWFAQATSNYNNQRVSFAVSKRANPSVAIYNPGTGVANQIRNLDSNTDYAGVIGGISTSGLFGYVNGVSVGVSVSLGYHYTASSEL